MKLNTKVDQRYFWDEEYHRFALWVHQRHADPAWRHKVDCTLLALSTGMRVSELTKATLAGCNPAGIVLVPSNKGKREHKSLVDPRWLLWYQDFLHRSHGPLLMGGACKRTLERWWNDCCEDAGVRNLGGIHGARHTYATWAVASGWLELHEVSACLGHASLAITADFYVSALLERKLLDGTPPKWWGAAQIQASNVVSIRRTA